jgi:hypothetical protein
VAVIAFTLVVVVGSLAEINAQSAGYRASINTGYAALASRLVVESNQTGRQLATLVNEAPNFANIPLPNTVGQTARSEIQQALDRAVSDSARQAVEASQLVPPYPTGDVSARLTGVMATRATAVARLRTAVDQMLGMSSLPIAGSPPSTTTTTSAAPLQSPEMASQAMSAAGLLFERADTAYRALASEARNQHTPIRLPRSAWVTSPTVDAALGTVRLAAFAPSLNASVPLYPFHQLVLTAVGLSPAAVASGEPGTVGDGCAAAAQSVGTGTTPTVLPPTGTVSVDATVTNCGTVGESDVKATQTLTLVDPSGTALPPVGARGASSHVEVSVPAGSSVALDLPSLPVAGGHLYTLEVSISIPFGQQSGPYGSAGSSQEFLLQISA